MSDSNRFKDAFWSGDFTSTSGYDILIQRLSDGRKTSKDLEDLVKQRAVLEERYGKELMQLARKAGGQNEINTLRRAFDTMKQQLENAGNAHIQLAGALREEAKRGEDFRERQKEQRRRMEAIMDKLHKLKNNLYKKTMDGKKCYEQKCQEADEAEIAADNRMATGNVKQQEKLKAKVLQTRESSVEADKTYKQNVEALDALRKEWQKEHQQSCQFFDKQECERIVFLRRTMWIHSNLLSQQCVKDDEMYEVVRESLEQCDVKADIKYFIQLKQTGSEPPAPVLYENYYNRDNHGGQKIARDGMCTSDSSDYEFVTQSFNRKQVRVKYSFSGQTSDTLSLEENEVITLLDSNRHDGWCLVERNHTTGFVPLNYLDL
uniref:proline-serine-threonine phosphatase-interacting protein 1-like n=1 Tax=Myxine glutinosa TaxID=7769 RepID=UPI00358FF6D5